MIHEVQREVSPIWLALLQRTSQSEHHPNVHIMIMSGGRGGTLLSDVPNSNKDFCNDMLKL